MENGYITAPQLEAVRKILVPILRNVGKLWFCVVPNMAMSKKPEQSRMGRGKGPVDHFVARVRAGKMLLEINNIPLPTAKLILKMAAFKLPIKTRIMIKDQMHID